MRVALGIAYRGSAYSGWQSQPGGRTVQDQLDQALSAFVAAPLKSICAGRTDAGVHALNQVVHSTARSSATPIRGCAASIATCPPTSPCNGAGSFPPASIRAPARSDGAMSTCCSKRRCAPQSRQAWPAGRFASSTAPPCEQAALALVGKHDFSAFRSAECQALSPVKTMRSLHIERREAYWRFSFDADAFLHHMIRNVVGGLVAVGSGARPASWLAEVLAARERARAAATFAPDGLYFLGPYYDPAHAIPERTAAMGWLL